MAHGKRAQDGTETIKRIKTKYDIMVKFNEKKSNELASKFVEIFSDAFDNGKIDIQEIENQDLGNEFAIAMQDACNLVIQGLTGLNYDRLEFNYMINRLIHQIKN